MPPDVVLGPASHDDRWLDEKRVSEMIGLSLSTLRKQRFSSVGIPYYKLGRAVRYKLTDVISYMESKKIMIRHLAHSRN